METKRPILGTETAALADFNVDVSESVCVCVAAAGSLACLQCAFQEVAGKDN